MPLYCPSGRSLLTSRKFWTLIPTRSFPVGASSDLAAEGAWGVVAQEDSSSAAKDIVASRIILDPFSKRRPADFALDHRPGRLSRAEPGDPDPRRQPGIGLIDRFRNLVGVDFDREHDLRARFPLGIDLHRGHGALRYQFELISTTSKWVTAVTLRPLGEVGGFPPRSYVTNNDEIAAELYPCEPCHVEAGSP